MRLSTSLLVVAGAGLLGFGVGALTRSTPGERPAVVEAVLEAIDRDDPAALDLALSRVGDPTRLAATWRDEVVLGTLVRAGDRDALWRFATASPKGPARARALLRLAQTATRPEDRDLAFGRLRADYPNSWALPRTGTTDPR